MADPVVHLTNGVPDSGTGNVTTLGQTLLDGANVTIGAKADAKNAATDTTAVSAVSIWKQISASIQAAAASLAGTLTVATHAVTGSGNFASTVADGANTTLGAKADAKNTATDTTSISIMSVLKQISASVQATMGFAVNTGASSATTLRTTLASDSAGIIATGTQAAPSAAYLSTVAAGDIAAAASDSGNPVKIGGVGKTANPTAVTDGQRVNALFDKLGKQVVVGAVRDLKGVQQTSVSNTTSETTVVTAGGAGVFNDMNGLILANTGASTTKVTVKDATGGTTRAIIEVPTLETRGFMLPVDSAVPQAAANNNWTVTCGTATTALEVTAFYVKNT